MGLYISELIELLTHNQVKKNDGRIELAYHVHMELFRGSWKAYSASSGALVPAGVRVQNHCRNWRLVENHQECWKALRAMRTP